MSAGHATGKTATTGPAWTRVAGFWFSGAFASASGHPSLLRRDVQSASPPTDRLVAVGKPDIQLVRPIVGVAVTDHHVAVPRHAEATAERNHRASRCGARTRRRAGRGIAPQAICGDGHLTRTEGWIGRP